MNEMVTIPKDEYLRLKAIEEDMADLAIQTKKFDFKLEQVQDFTPTPMTVATVIYYSGIHPYTLEETYTPISQNEKLQQRMYLFWYKKEYQDKIKERLKSFQRFDIIQKLFPGKEAKQQTLQPKGKKHPFKSKRNPKRSRQ